MVFCYGHWWWLSGSLALCTDPEAVTLLLPLRWLADQQAPGVCLPPHPSIGVSCTWNHTWLLYGCLFMELSPQPNWRMIFERQEAHVALSCSCERHVGRGVLGDPPKAGAVPFTVLSITGGRNRFVWYRVLFFLRSQCVGWLFHDSTQLKNLCFGERGLSRCLSSLESCTI